MRLHRGMRRVRVSLALVAPALLAGCGYIHFGKLPAGSAAGTDAAMSAAYSNLTTEHKMLKQELALVRKQGDALRLALERGGAVPAPAAHDSAAQLSETARELASLRASYAKLQAEKGGVAADATSHSAANTELEEKLAGALRTSTRLQEENARLRQQVDRTAAENAALAEQLKNSLALTERAQGALGELNADLLAQKEARARAEQASEALRAQLSTVLAHRPAVPPSEIRRDPVAAQSLTSLQIAKAPPADSSPTAELRVNTSQLRPGYPGESIAVSPRVHVVNAGDTLESIARQYLGAADRWTLIYEVNSAQLSNGQPMRAGMELQIPEK
jgi:nucleoid-associated protein YgaU